MLMMYPKLFQADARHIVVWVLVDGFVLEQVDAVTCCHIVRLRSCLMRIRRFPFQIFARQRCCSGTIEGLPRDCRSTSEQGTWPRRSFQGIRICVLYSSAGERVSSAVNLDTHIGHTHFRLQRHPLYSSLNPCFHNFALWWDHVKNQVLSSRLLLIILDCVTGR